MKVNGTTSEHLDDQVSKEAEKQRSKLEKTLVVPSVITPPPSPRNFDLSKQQERDLGNQLWRPAEMASCNTVPSCDPDDTAHLTPRRVNFPSQWGTCSSVSAGSQHTALLTTHGALYMFGRNMSGQLGTGNRLDSPNPVRVLEESTVLSVSCGCDFTLATDSCGQIWVWGSNFYSQLGRVSNSGGGDKPQAGKFFTLKTTKRVLKVPHSIHTNVETPRVLTGFPSLKDEKILLSGPTEPTEVLSGFSQEWLRNLQFGSIEEHAQYILKNKALPSMADPLDQNCSPIKYLRRSSSVIPTNLEHSYGPVTLHSALTFFNTLYDADQMMAVLESSGAYQALAALSFQKGFVSKALHYNIKAAATHSSTSTGQVEEILKVVEKSFLDNVSESTIGELVKEALTSFSESSLPLEPLEQLLLKHMPSTVYPLAVLLFSGCKTENNGSPGSALLRQLSTKFCVNVCASVISHIHENAGENIMQDLVNCSSDMDGDSSSAHDLISDALRKTDPSAWAVSQQDREIMMQKENSLMTFKCGHTYLPSTFFEKYLPELRSGISSVPGLLGSTARLLMEQYAGTQQKEDKTFNNISMNLMACPYCLLAYLLGNIEQPAT